MSFRRNLFNIKHGACVEKGFLRMTVARKLVGLMNSRAFFKWQAIKSRDTGGLRL